MDKQQGGAEVQHEPLGAFGEGEGGTFPHMWKKKKKETTFFG